MASRPRTERQLQTEADHYPVTPTSWRVYDQAVADHDLPVSEGGDPGVVGDEHNSRALRPRAVHDQAHDGLPGQGVERTGGFVGENDLGLGHQRPGQRHPLRLSAGQFSGAPAFQALEPETPEPVHGPLVSLFPAHPVEQERQGDVVCGAQLGDKLAELEHETKGSSGAISFAWPRRAGRPVGRRTRLPRCRA